MPPQSQNIPDCMELLSGNAFRAEPTTCPELFTALASLWYPPPGKVPKSMIVPCFQRTARSWGRPGYKGSVSPFSETPATRPFALIQIGTLLPPPGSAPRSVKLPPLVARNACTTSQSQKQMPGNGSVAEVSAKPATVPTLFRTDEPENSSPLPGTK